MQNDVEIKKVVKIEKLNEIVKGKHGTYYLAKRNEDVAIYSKDFPYPSKCYEVFIINKIDGKKSAESLNKRFGRNYDVSSAPDIKEKYPVDEDFGKTAWTYKDYDIAERRFELLTKELEEKRIEKQQFRQFSISQ